MVSMSNQSLEWESNPQSSPYQGDVLPLNYPGTLASGFKLRSAYPHRSLGEDVPLTYPGVVRNCSILR